MDESTGTPPEKKPFNKIDLSALSDFTFGTQWSGSDSDEGSPSSARREDRGRGERGRGENRAGGRSGGPVRRDRRPERPQRSQAPGGQAGEGGPGGDRRFPRREGERGHRPRMQDHRPYESPHFDLAFYPEEHGFGALIKAMRASCLTYELFEIAKLILEKPDRYIVAVHRRAAAEGEEKRLLHIAVPDNLPFPTEEEAINHVVAHHLGSFFKTETVEVDPPKGSFPIICRCPHTGVLLGPPNFHRFPQIVQQHHAARVAHIPFDRYRNSLENIRDEAVVQEWLAGMKTTTRYTYLGGAGKPRAAGKAKPADAPESPAAVESETTSESRNPADAPAASPVEATAAAETIPPADVSAAESGAEGGSGPAAEEASLEPSPVEETPATEPVSAEAPAEPPAEPPAGPAAAGGEDATEAVPHFDSREEAIAHLLRVARNRVLRQADYLRVHGKTVEDYPDTEIHRAVHGALERQRRFPMDTANALRGRLRREHFHIFKRGQKGITYVCSVKRRQRTPGQVFADSIQRLIDFIEANPMIEHKELPARFLDLEPEMVAAAAQPPAAGEDAALAEPRERIRKVMTDLRWLISEGYVTAFAHGGALHAAPAAQPRPEPPARPAAPPAEAKPEAETAEDKQAPASTGGAPPAPAGDDPPAPADAPPAADAAAAPEAPSEEPPSQQHPSSAETSAARPDATENFGEDPASEKPAPPAPPASGGTVVEFGRPADKPPGS